MADTIPVLFDTDIGSDIDDAIALAYLLRQPRCELTGITTVTGDVAKRAALAQMLCDAVGRSDIPIHAGTSSALLHGSGQPQVPHYASVSDVPHRLDWAPNTAIDFMRRTIRARPGEVVLLSVGPMTNVALLFAIDPEVAGLLHSWVSMSGVFTDTGGRPLEWNCRCDPVATAMAFRAAVPEHIHVPLDVTMRCSMTAEEAREGLRGPLSGLVLRMAESWFEKRGEIVFHDPLAAVLPYQPQICRYETGSVTVDPATGKTSFQPGDAGHDRVAVAVEPQAFFAEYAAIVNAR